jgi:hypothetical protein
VLVGRAGERQPCTPAASPRQIDAHTISIGVVGAASPARSTLLTHMAKEFFHYPETAKLFDLLEEMTR